MERDQSPVRVIKPKPMESSVPKRKLIKVLKRGIDE